MAQSKKPKAKPAPRKKPASKAKKATTAKKPTTKAGTGNATASARKRSFALTYLINGSNATQAAKKAGYSEASAHTTGWQMLQDPEVRAIIAAERKRVLEQHRHDLDSLVSELAQIGLFDIRAVLDENGALLKPSEWPSFAGKVISGVEVSELFENVEGTKELIGYLKKVKLWDKNSALEKLVRILGGYEKDNSQLGESIGRAIVVPAKEGQR